MKNEEDVSVSIPKAGESSEPESDGAVSENAEQVQASSPQGRVRGALSAASHTFGGALIGGVRSLWQSGFGVKSVSRSVSHGVGRAADFLNVPKKGLAITMAALMLGGGTTAAVVAGNTAMRDLLLKQEDYYDDCTDMLADAEITQALVKPGGEVSGSMEENAQKMWALGKSLGMTDEQCAGFLGCVQIESNLDATAVEGIFDEPFAFGAKKASAFPIGEHMNAYFQDLVLRTHVTLNQDAYRVASGSSNFCCGIGLFQWTGPRGKELLDFADGLGKNWYELEVQLAFVLRDGSGERNKLDTFIRDAVNASSVADATASFLGYIVSNVGRPDYGHNYDLRLNAAQSWYARLSAQSDSISLTYGDFANSVVTAAGATVMEATGAHVSAVMDECSVSLPVPDNSSLAASAVAYAWETQEMGYGNNGTELYRSVHDAMFPGDTWYQSCDRGVACAVVWSGADDTFPVGNTDVQDAYLSSHSREAGESDPDAIWEHIGSYDDCWQDLQPGDILVTTGARRGTDHGHIMMFVGNEEIQKKYPNASGEFVSASYDERSPGCGDVRAADPSNPSQEKLYGGDGYEVYRYCGTYSGTKKTLYSGMASGTS